MKKLCFLVLFLNNLAVALPDHIICRPTQYYSGGFNIYQIHRATFTANEQYIGYVYWQKTSGHGLLIDTPVLKGRVALVASQENNDLTLRGFISEINVIDSIKLPADWDGRSQLIHSNLFNNDLFSDGECKNIHP